MLIGLIVGGIIGFIVGFIAAYLWVNWALLQVLKSKF